MSVRTLNIIICSFAVSSKDSCYFVFFFVTVISANVMCLYCIISENTFKEFFVSSSYWRLVMSNIFATLLMCVIVQLCCAQFLDSSQPWIFAEVWWLCNCLTSIINHIGDCWLSFGPFIHCPSIGNLSLPLCGAVINSKKKPMQLSLCGPATVAELQMGAASSCWLRSLPYSLLLGHC
jgi:hypothetical protein